MIWVFCAASATLWRAGGVRKIVVLHFGRCMDKGDTSENEKVKGAFRVWVWGHPIVEYKKKNKMQELSIEQIFTSLITSSVTAVVVVFLVKKMIERSIDSAFNRAEKKQSAIVDMKIEAGSSIFEKEISIFPEMMEVIYRCRNVARECTNESTRNIKVIKDFNGYKIHLTENLYKYRLFLPEQIFKKLHDFKIEIQEIGVLLDQLTRSKNTENSNSKILDLAKKEIGTKYDRINAMFEELDIDIRNYLKSKSEI